MRCVIHFGSLDRIDLQLNTKRPAQITNPEITGLIPGVELIKLSFQFRYQLLIRTMAIDADREKHDGLVKTHDFIISRNQFVVR